MKEKSSLRIRASVKKQINIVFFIAVIVPVCTLGVISAAMLVNRLQERYEMQGQAEAMRVKGILFDITTTVYSNSEAIVNNQKYREIFSQENKIKSELYNESLEENLRFILKSTYAIKNIEIVTSNPYVETNEWIKYDPDLPEDRNWYPNGKESIWNNWCSCEDSSGEGLELLLVRKINTGLSEYEAYLVISIDQNYLKNRLISTDFFLLLSVDGESAFFSSSKYGGIIPINENKIGEFYSYMGSMNIDGKKMLTSISTLLPFKVSNKFYILVGDGQAYEEIRRLIFLFVITTFVVIIGPAVLVIYFSANFSNRIMVLRGAMHQVSKGDYNIIEKFNGEDELADTFQDLKDMIGYIHEKEAEYFQTQLNEQKLINMQQKMEFKMLASQINPHFLYNTLEAIRMQALSLNAPEISTSIMLLAKSMHYVLENTEEIYTTLNNELEHVTNYLMIQKLRYQERINWNFYIDENMDPDRYIILPLLLQPIVENAVVHGLENKNAATQINIIIEKENENIYVITISDNGGGIEEEKLKEIIGHMQEKRESRTFGIALGNVNQRIKLYYGEQFGVSIESARHKGTSVSLKLPIEIQGRDDKC